MSDEALLTRISIIPGIMTGKPVIKGTRLTVEFILNLMAHGESAEQICAEYQGLTTEDIQACLLYATRALNQTSIYPLIAEPV